MTLLVAVAGAYLDVERPSTRGAASASAGAGARSSHPLDTVSSQTVGAAEPHPTAAKAANREPIGRPAPQPSGPGRYQFMMTQSASSAPVTFDPCRSIAVVVNERTMPPGATGLVQEALDEVSRATGLEFRIERVTDEPPAAPRSAFQPDRYGDVWAPVLIAWTDAKERPDLQGDVAGRAGPLAYRDPASGNLVYVSGEVELDGPDFVKMLGGRDGRAEAKAVILHELGHLVGLDHVADETQIMSPTITHIVDFGAGDRRGLAQLGQGPCVPLL